jgi:PHD/YefM family antitoxin component YafN of YafNO toxin-antitoxin module
MIDLANIFSLTEFQKQTKKHLRRLKKTGQPQVLTLNGHAEIVVQSAKAYQELLDRAELTGSVRTVGRRNASPAKRDVPAEKVLAEIRNKLGLEGPR